GGALRYRMSLIRLLRVSRTVFFFSSRRRHTRFSRDWSSDVCSSDLVSEARGRFANRTAVPGLSIFLPLAMGQFVGHWALTGLTGHHTGTGSAVGESPTGGPLSAAMFGAHLFAVLLCTLTITVAERLYRAASAVLRVLLTPVRRFPPAPRVCIAAIVATPRNHAPNGASGPRAPPRRG